MRRLSDVIDFRDACADLSRLVESVSDDVLAAPTPCADYDVAGLLEHVEEFATGFTEMAGAQLDVDRIDAVRTPAERRLVAEHVLGLGRAWAVPDPWVGDTDNGGLALSNAVWGRIVLTEVIVHGWDLAVATGQPFDPPAELVAACHDHVAVFVPDAPVPALWGTQVALDDVDLLERTVAITGRDPRPWREPERTNRSGRTDVASLVVRAPLTRVFAALVDQDALVEWLPPAGMTGHFAHFDARSGGAYRLTLTYDDAPASGGKSSVDSDVVQARFLEIVPDDRVVQAIDFESDDPSFAGTMTMTWSVSAVENGTRVQITAENVPRGIAARDHEDGMTSSLRQLDAFVTGSVRT
ncbi:TIGR03086 family metal-binding protein [Gordonia sp. CPCC 205515]|uniref:TIGR03086 family metal-binding protein n=1 Tax=Gordonia sp. CPCC 205515 TaxID=3140791 RepID=UPI003AF3C03D